MIILRLTKNSVGYEATFFKLFHLLKALKILRNKYSYIAVTVIMGAEPETSFTHEEMKRHDEYELYLMETWIDD